VPYGIDRGICDRNVLANELKNASSGKPGGFGGGVVAPLVSSTIGARMDMVDQNCVGRILEFAPDSRRVYWRSPDSGITYAVVPTRTYQNAMGAYCREFHTSASSGSHLQQLQGLACRRNDGAWRTAD
jgi:surface antigen